MSTRSNVFDPKNVRVVPTVFDGELHLSVPPAPLSHGLRFALPKDGVPSHDRDHGEVLGSCRREQILPSVIIADAIAPSFTGAVTKNQTHRNIRADSELSDAPDPNARLGRRGH